MRKFFSPFRRFGFVYKYFNGRDFRSQVLNPHVNSFVFELRFCRADAVALMQRRKLRMVELVSMKAAHYLLCPLKEGPHSHIRLEGEKTQ